MVATGVEYLREMCKRGVPVEDTASRMRFGFSLGSNFFMEIAKLRAVRLLWEQVVEAFGGTPQARKMTIHARTSAYTKTVADPYVNMLRNTTEAFSGVMGGVDSCTFVLSTKPSVQPMNFPGAFPAIFRSYCNRRLTWSIRSMRPEGPGTSKNSRTPWPGKPGTTFRASKPKAA